jgi:hypothetical protein
MIAAVLGWIGTVGTFGAYVLLSRGLWHATSIRYAALNGVAGFLGAVGSSLYGAWPSVVSNLLWSGVSAYSIVLTLRERRGARRAGSVEPMPGRDRQSGDVLVLARAA